MKKMVFALIISFYPKYLRDNLGANIDRSPIPSFCLYIMIANYYYQHYTFT